MKKVCLLLFLAVLNIYNPCWAVAARKVFGSYEFTYTIGGQTIVDTIVINNTTSDGSLSGTIQGFGITMVGQANANFVCVSQLAGAQVSAAYCFNYKSNKPNKAEVIATLSLDNAGNMGSIVLTATVKKSRLTAASSSERQMPQSPESTMDYEKVQSREAAFRAAILGNMP